MRRVDRGGFVRDVYVEGRGQRSSRTNHSGYRGRTKADARADHYDAKGRRHRGQCRPAQTGKRTDLKS